LYAGTVRTLLDSLDWKIINLLRLRGPLYFNEICRNFPGKSKSTIKKHLSKLEKLALIYSFKEKNRKYYELYGNYLKLINIYNELLTLSECSKILEKIMRNIHRIPFQIDVSKISKCQDMIVRVLLIAVR